MCVYETYSETGVDDYLIAFHIPFCLVNVCICIHYSLYH